MHVVAANLVFWDVGVLICHGNDTNEPPRFPAIFSVTGVRGGSVPGLAGFPARQIHDLLVCQNGVMRRWLESSPCNLQPSPDQLRASARTLRRRLLPRGVLRDAATTVKR